MSAQEIAELRRAFGEPLEPESWHDAKVLRALDERDALLAAVRAVEWRGVDGDGFAGCCPACAGFKETGGHKWDCIVGRGIAKAEAAQ